jgi:hypothetical protein
MRNRKIIETNEDFQLILQIVIIKISMKQNVYRLIQTPQRIIICIVAMIVYVQILYLHTKISTSIVKFQLYRE